MNSNSITSESEITVNDSFEKLSDAANGIVSELRQSLGIPFLKLAEDAGCSDPERVNSYFSIGQGCLSGKDWERLITHCTLPEMWVFRARVSPPKYTLVAGAGGSQDPPSDDTLEKIGDILSTTSWFYQEATRRFLAQRTPILDHKGTSV